MTPEEYYEYAEHYFNVLQSELEKAQEEGSDVEAEYSVRFPVSFLYIIFCLSSSSSFFISFLACIRPSVGMAYKL